MRAGFVELLVRTTEIRRLSELYFMKPTEKIEVDHSRLRLRVSLQLWKELKSFCSS